MILLAEIAFGVFASIYAKRFREFITPTLESSIKYEYYGDMSNKTIVSIAWDVVMYNVRRRVEFKLSLLMSIIFSLNVVV